MAASRVATTGYPSMDRVPGSRGPMTPHILTIEDVEIEQQRRRYEQGLIAKSVKSAMARARSPEGVHSRGGCFSWLSSFLSRWRHNRAHRRLLDIEVPHESVANSSSAGIANATASATASQSKAMPAGMTTALFGQRRCATAAQGTAASSLAHQKLAALGASLANRMSTVEERAAALRKEAASLMKQGKKDQALRALKRCKAQEKQLANLSAQASAVERQSDMMEDAQLQQEIANALSASVSNMKQSKRVLKDVEEATDATQELQDIAEDVHAAFASINDRANDDLSLDDDELLEELAGLAAATATEEAVSDPAAREASATSSTAFPTVPQTVAVMSRAGEAASSQPVVAAAW